MKVVADRHHGPNLEARVRAGHRETDEEKGYGMLLERMEAWEAAAEAEQMRQLPAEDRRRRKSASAASAAPGQGGAPPRSPLPVAAAGAARATATTTTTSTATTSSTTDEWFFLNDAATAASIICNCAVVRCSDCGLCSGMCSRCWWPTVQAPWMNGTTFNTYEYAPYKETKCTWGQRKEGCECDCSMTWPSPSRCFSSCSQCAWNTTNSWTTRTTSTRTTTTRTGGTPWPTYTGDCPCWHALLQRCFAAGDLFFKFVCR